MISKKKGENRFSTSCERGNSCAGEVESAADRKWRQESRWGFRVRGYKTYFRSPSAPPPHIPQLRRPTHIDRNRLFSKSTSGRHINSSFDVNYFLFHQQERFVSASTGAGDDAGWFIGWLGPDGWRRTFQRFGPQTHPAHAPCRHRGCCQPSQQQQQQQQPE